MDADRIMRLVPKWFKMVQDWDSLVKMLLGKMFAETSNAVIPRFLSDIGNHLADVTHIFFKLLISHMQKQKEANITPPFALNSTSRAPRSSELAIDGPRMLSMRKNNAHHKKYMKDRYISQAWSFPWKQMQMQMNSGRY